MAVYGYARVSTTDQNLDRQLEQLREYVKDERCIITDKASGKDFDRHGYNTLVGTADTAPLLHKGDLLVISNRQTSPRPNYKDNHSPPKAQIPCRTSPGRCKNHSDRSLQGKTCSSEVSSLKK